ncbi:MAG TPA: hypothetical protein PKM73_11090 [Verrucomicrobiota bacterium]|nr:hypothetical protein [Verrucomicrobiota bacterium]HNU50281.1 hypothetical protein [Verrucomicrobiota bacterium]
MSAIPVPIDTLTLYVGPARSDALTAAILATRPRRVIFNPGTENPALGEGAAGTIPVHPSPAAVSVRLR